MLLWLLGPFHLKLKNQRCEGTTFLLDSLVIGPTLLLMPQECRVDGWVLVRRCQRVKNPYVKKCILILVPKIIAASQNVQLTDD